MGPLSTFTDRYLFPPECKSCCPLTAGVSALAGGSAGGITALFVADKTIKVFGAGFGVGGTVGLTLATPIAAGFIACCRDDNPKDDTNTADNRDHKPRPLNSRVIITQQPHVTVSVSKMTSGLGLRFHPNYPGRAHALATHHLSGDYCGGYYDSGHSSGHGGCYDGGHGGCDSGGGGGGCGGGE
ncbi:hypothetical protein [Endozoicomonas acroporae]|uniref:hypothetical protein n=1 Tax=Endozoicomonas acroporae TaxID=1701104 RepID=UPI0013D7F11F|nr:hypothetical protein [Endozoicomonas acroporae]